MPAFSRKDEFLLVLADDSDTLSNKLTKLCEKWKVKAHILSSTKKIHQTKTLQMIAQMIVDDMGDNQK